MPSSRYARPRHKAFTAEAVRGEGFRGHKSHDSSGDPIGRQHKAESNIVMIAAGKNEHAHQENRAEPREPTPQSTVPSAIVPSVMQFSTSFGYASAPPTTLSDTPPPLLPTFASKTSETKELLSESLASAHATTSLVSTSKSASRSPELPHALLAFTLVFVCLFCAVMFLALWRMFSRKKVGVQLVVPHDATNSESDQKIDEAMELKKQTMVESDAMVVFDQGRRDNLLEHRSDSLERARQADQRRTSFDMHTNTIHQPLPAHFMRSAQSTRSRVLHPYAPRSYHHPYSAYNGEAEAVVPLAAANGFENAESHKNRGKVKGVQSKVHTTSGEKENVKASASHHSRRHRNNLSARAVDRRLSVSTVHELVAPSATINSTRDDPTSEVFSSSSVLNMKGDDISIAESDVDTRLPTASTIAVDIGLAMLAEFSSPEIGPQSDSQSRSGSSLALGYLENHPARPGTFPSHSNIIDPCESGVFSHVVPSKSSECGLAYLASSSSPSLTEKSTEEGLKSDLGLDARAQAHARLVEQLNLAIDAPAPAPAAVSFQAPLLPTLSEMALSRTDPLYESVTNELFASYGVRISTASGTERTSRVSASISRMLSWVEDSASGESTTSDDGTCGVLGREWLSERRDAPGSVTDHGGVRPLRVNGKLLCKSSA